MLPSLQHLVRERALLSEVLRGSCSPAEGAPPPDTAGRSRSFPPATAAGGTRSGWPGAAAEGTAKRRGARSSGSGGGDGLQHLPHELLAAIGEHFLESPVWHACKLGEASPRLGQVFMHESLWQNFMEGRFRAASRSPKRCMHPCGPERGGGSMRLSYAQLHTLEARFRGGQYGARGVLDNPHQGVAVLDLHVAPTGDASAVAFAALRDGAIMVYDLDPVNGAGHRNAFSLDGDLLVDEDAPLHAAPLFELAPVGPPAPALCCLPILEAGRTTAEGGAVPPLLAAGFASGRLGAWQLPNGHPLVPATWDAAHHGRVNALSVMGNGTLLSASSDGLLKAWSLDDGHFGSLRRVFAGHGAAVVSVAASPHDPNLFLSGSHDRSVRLWDVRVGGEAATATVARWQQQDWVTCVDFHPTVEHRALSSDKGVHQWDLRSLAALSAGGAAGAGPGPHLSTSHKHRKLVSRFRADPLRLASCSLDGSVKVSSLEAPSVRVASPLASPTASPHLSPSSPPPLPEALRGLLGDGGDACTLRTSTDYVLCIDFDATRLLVGGVDGRVDIYDFTHPGHFLHGPLADSPTRHRASRLGAALASRRRGGGGRRCGDAVDIQMEGLQEIEA